MFSGHFSFSAGNFCDRKIAARHPLVSLSLLAAFVILLISAAPLVSSAEDGGTTESVLSDLSSVNEEHAFHEEAVGKGTELPEIFKVSVDLLLIGDEGKKEEFMEKIGNLLSDSGESDAAEALGTALSAERKRSPAYLAFYCRSILYLAGTSMEERIEFLSAFLRGYGKKGVLVLAGEGAKRFKASGSKRGEYWRIVKEGDVPSGRLDRIYPSPDAVYIPFEQGEIFILDVISLSDRETHLWKVLPGSVTQKTWPGGVWEREITVRGDRTF